MQDHLTFAERQKLCFEELASPPTERKYETYIREGFIAHFPAHMIQAAISHTGAAPSRCYYGTAIEKRHSRYIPFGSAERHERDVNRPIWQDSSGRFVSVGSLSVQDWRSIVRLLSAPIGSRTVADAHEYNTAIDDGIKHITIIRSADAAPIVLTREPYGTVTVSGNAHVVSHVTMTTIMACDTSTVEASAGTVYVSGAATADISGRVRCYACEHSTVLARDEAMIDATDHATVNVENADLPADAWGPRITPTVTINAGRPPFTTRDLLTTAGLFIRPATINELAAAEYDPESHSCRVMVDGVECRVYK
jgi:hypothetical protein